MADGDAGGDVSEIVLEATMPSLRASTNAATAARSRLIVSRFCRDSKALRAVRFLGHPMTEGENGARLQPGCV